MEETSAWDVEKIAKTNFRVFTCTWNKIISEIFDCMKLSKLRYRKENLLKAPIEVQKFCAHFYKRDL